MTPPTITTLALDGEETRPSDDAVAAHLSIEVVHPTAVTATSRRGMNQRNNGPLLPTCHARITSTLWIQALEIAHVRAPRVRVLDCCRVNRPYLNTISVLEHDHSGVASRERRCRGHVRTFGGPKGPGHTLTSISALVSRSSARSCSPSCNSRWAPGITMTPGCRESSAQNDGAAASIRMVFIPPPPPSRNDP
jgi:hypothetical protein